MAGKLGLVLTQKIEFNKKFRGNQKISTIPESRALTRSEGRSKESSSDIVPPGSMLFDFCTKYPQAAPT